MFAPKPALSASSTAFQASVLVAFGRIGPFEVIPGGGRSWQLKKAPIALTSLAVY
jgi:hypothetical protein